MARFQKETALATAVGAEMRAIRELKGLTVAEVAERMPGGNKNTTYKWERGVCEPGFDRWADWCLALDVKPANVITAALERAEATAGKVRTQQK